MISAVFRVEHEVIGTANHAYTELLTKRLHRNGFPRFEPAAALWFSERRAGWGAVLGTTEERGGWLRTENLHSFFCRVFVN
jgi:hypothetical protein